MAMQDGITCPAAIETETKTDRGWMDNVVDVLQSWTPWKRNDEEGEENQPDESDLHRLVSGFDATHVFATHEAYLVMDVGMWKKHGVNVVTVDVNTDAKCFGNKTFIFLPGIVGNLIFVAQFLPDGNLALILQMLTMLVEFSLAFLMQSKLSRSFVPRFFFLYVAAFLYYVLAYTAGYSWLACTVLVFSVVHLVMVFWNRCKELGLDRSS
eukprot:jgi/Pico_ML_1/50881/g2011.t1